MGSSPTGMALRLTQWFTRAIEFCCAALILSIFSYFFATLRGHSLHIPTWMRAVEGIAGAGVLYTLLCLCLLCCVAGHPFLSSIFILLDICFTGAFIYLAAANRDGASSCNGHVNTPIGRGNSSDNMVGNGQGGTIEMPSLHAACKMQTACLAVAIVGLLLFILSAILEFLLVRHRRKEKRYGASPVNGYTPGYGKTKPSFLSRFRRGNRKRTDLSDNSNVLPAHTHPDDLHRDSYGTEQTRVNTSHGYGHSADPDALPHTHNQPPMSGVNSGYGSYNYKPDSAVAPTAPQDQNLGAYTHHTEFANTGGTGATAPVHYPPGNYRYDDGVYDRI